MDFADSPEHAAFRSEFRRWLEGNLSPEICVDDAADQRVASDRETLEKRIGWQKAMHAAGWVGISWPKEYGGRGASFMEQVIFDEEFFRARAPVLPTANALNLLGPTLIHWGTEEQKKRHLPRILSADELWCQGYSEPDAGGDLASLRTRAVDRGDHFVVNGQKVWTSGAHFADWCFLLVRTDPDAPKHHGISYLLVAGRAKAALAWTEPNLRWDAAGITLRAGAAVGGFSLSGSKFFVGDAHLADILIVAARTRDGRTMEDGVSLFLVPKDTPGLTITVLPTIDETRKLCEVRLDSVALPPDALLSEIHQGWAPLSRVIARATVALAAEMCGGAQQVLDMTVAYAKIRIAFSKPIGSYQGVKHQAADMLVALENAKSLTYYAAWAVDQGLDEAPLAVSMAKAAASDMARKVAGTGTQLHGGIGMTWEHDLQLYFKRAKASEVAFGDGTWHRERVAQLMRL